MATITFHGTPDNQDAMRGIMNAMRGKKTLPTDAVQKAIGPRAQGWIMDYLLANDRWQTVRQIEKGTGKNAATIRRGLKMLVLARFVQEAKDTRAVYKVANREAWVNLLGVE